jgi:hypothetical protein
MGVGTESWEGQAVPLVGESEIKADTIGNDILTLTGASGHTADFLVCRLYAGTEKFSVDISGNVVAAGNILPSGFVATKNNSTTEPTTTHITTDGGLMVATVSGTVRLYFRVGGTVYYVNKDG